MKLTGFSFKREAIWIWIFSGLLLLPLLLIVLITLAVRLFS
jgi:hypothetical protein